MNLISCLSVNWDLVMLDMEIKQLSIVMQVRVVLWLGISLLKLCQNSDCIKTGMRPIRFSWLCSKPSLHRQSSVTEKVIRVKVSNCELKFGLITKSHVYEYVLARGVLLFGVCERQIVHNYLSQVLACLYCTRLGAQISELPILSLK